jgi:hypothetical protein
MKTNIGVKPGMRMNVNTLSPELLHLMNACWRRPRFDDYALNQPARPLTNEPRET